MHTVKEFLVGFKVFVIVHNPSSVYSGSDQSDFILALATFISNFQKGKSKERNFVPRRVRDFSLSPSSKFYSVTRLKSFLWVIERICKHEIALLLPGVDSREGM